MGALALCLITGLAWLVTRPWGATYAACSSDFSSSEIQELYSRVPDLLSDFEGWTMSDLEEGRRCIALGVAHDSLHAPLRRKLAFRGFPDGSTYIITVVWMHDAAELRTIGSQY